MPAAGEAQKSRKQRVYDVIFGYDTKAGKTFDLVLIIMISASVFAVMLDSIGWQSDTFNRSLFFLEWFFTLAFTLEYALRIYSSPKPRSYVLSYYGLIDLLSILPTYLAYFYAGF